MTYGAFARFIVEECKAAATTSGAAPGAWVEAANAKLFEEGERIGRRLVDEFVAVDAESRGLAARGAAPCDSVPRAVDVIAQRALPYYLGVDPQSVSVIVDRAALATAAPGAPQTLDIRLDESPLGAFVQLPRALKEARLWYSNMVCGAIAGALRMLDFPGTCAVYFVADKMCGDAETRIRVKYTPPPPPAGKK
jgi:hypothetical protein